MIGKLKIETEKHFLALGFFTIKGSVEWPEIKNKYFFLHLMYRSPMCLLFQAYFHNNYGGDRKSSWTSSTKYETSGLPHYTVLCVSTLHTVWVWETSGLPCVSKGIQLQSGHLLDWSHIWFLGTHGQCTH